MMYFTHWAAWFFILIIMTFYGIIRIRDNVFWTWVALSAVLAIPSCTIDLGIS